MKIEIKKSSQLISEIPELNQTYNHPWNHRLFKKISKSDIQIIEDFFNSQNESDKDKYFYNLNRFFLDNPDKPKNWKFISEILSNMGSIRYRR